MYFHTRKLGWLLNNPAPLWVFTEGLLKSPPWFWLGFPNKPDPPIIGLLFVFDWLNKFPLFPNKVLVCGCVIADTPNKPLTSKFKFSINSDHEDAWNI